MPTTPTMAVPRPTLHHLENSQSHLVLWLLEEMGIEYNLILHKRVNKRSPPALQAAHPLGKSPTLITSLGRLITERSAISLWLINNYEEGARFRLSPPRPLPPLPSIPASTIATIDSNAATEDDAVREDQLISIGGATLNPLLMMKLVFDQLVLQAPFLVRPVFKGVRWVVNRVFLDAELAHVVKYLEQQLAVPPGVGEREVSFDETKGKVGSKGEDKGDDEDGGRDYFLGTEEPTRADFSLMWYFDFAFQCGWIDFDKYPRLKAFHTRCTSRPAWKRALEKGNGYDLTA